MLTDGLRLSGDVAYLPSVKFEGTDNHVLRNIISPEWGRGRGVQLEAILSYSVTPSFSVGAGGRYWAMWTREAYTAFGGAPCPCQTLPSRTERYGMFLQAAYRFDAPAAVVAKTDRRCGDDRNTRARYLRGCGQFLPKLGKSAPDELVQHLHPFL
jgi:hypothetical protein